jgi:hypothetical protein
MSILVSILRAILALQAKLNAVQSTVQSNSDKLDLVLSLLQPDPAVGFVFTATLEGNTQIGVTQMDLRDDQQAVLSIQPVDKKGKPAQLDGIPTWAGSDDTVITVTPSDDGLNATVVGVAPGTARVVVTGDADLGAGINPITGILDFNVTAGAAATINITAGAPTDQA